MPNGLSGGCSSENYIWTWKGRGVNSALQQLYSEQPSKNGSNKNIAKGTMDLGVDCFDRFWMYCILCIFCIFWTVPVYNSVLMQVFHHVRHFLHHRSRLPLREELLSAHQGDKGQQTSQYLINILSIFCRHTKETSINKQNNIWSSCFTLEFCLTALPPSSTQIQDTPALAKVLIIN